MNLKIESIDNSFSFKLHFIIKDKGFLEVSFKGFYDPISGDIFHVDKIEDCTLTSFSNVSHDYSSDSLVNNHDRVKSGLNWNCVDAEIIYDVSSVYHDVIEFDKLVLFDTYKTEVFNIESNGDDVELKVIRSNSCDIGAYYESPVFNMFEEPDSYVAHDDWTVILRIIVIAVCVAALVGLAIV